LLQVSSATTPLQNPQAWSAVAYGTLTQKSTCIPAWKKKDGRRAYLKGHKLVVWFWRPCIDFNPIFRGNGKKLNAMEIY